MKRNVLVAGLFAILPALTAMAHQPKIVTGYKHPPENPIEISNPDISQVYYGELAGEPDYYAIHSEREFGLYIQLLSPKIRQRNAEKDFSAEVLQGAQSVAELRGLDFQWMEFYEPFAGDEYWRGPSFEEPHARGEYRIKVYSPDNLGKYALVVGRTESFPVDEWGRLIVTLPRLKRYFEKTAWLAFFNLTGLFFLILIIFLAAIGYGVRRLIMRFRKRAITSRP